SDRTRPPRAPVLTPFIQLLELALLGPFVIPKSVEPGTVPDPPGSRVVIANLDHQLGPQLDPLQLAPAGPAAGLGGAALAGLQRRKHRAHAVFRRFRKPGNVPDGAQLIAFVEAEDQGADGSLLFARSPAHHHTVDRSLALDLRHPPAFAGLIRRAEV